VFPAIFRQRVRIMYTRKPDAAPAMSAYGRLLPFAGPDPKDRLRGIAAARRSAAWLACVDHGGPRAADTHTLRIIGRSASDELIV